MNPSDGRHGYAGEASYAYAPTNGNGGYATGAQAYQDSGRFLYGPAPDATQQEARQQQAVALQQGMTVPQLISSAGDVATAFIHGHAAEKAAREQQRLQQFQQQGPFPWRTVMGWGIPAAIGAAVVYFVMKG